MGSTKDLQHIKITVQSVRLEENHYSLKIIFIGKSCEYQL